MECTLQHEVSKDRSLDKCVWCGNPKSIKIKSRKQNPTEGPQGTNLRQGKKDSSTWFLLAFYVDEIREKVASDLAPIRSSTTAKSPL